MASITYFPQAGPKNTEEVLQIARTRAQELGIRAILVATTGGVTGARAVEVLRGHQVIAVTHAHGWRTPNAQELTEENRAKIIAVGGIILTATHPMGALGRAVRRHFNTYETEEIIANTFRILGQGMKVTCEITVMAADAGLVRTDEEVISIGGTRRGADTAIGVRPANAQDFFDLRVKEILCKPRF